MRKTAQNTTRFKHEMCTTRFSEHVYRHSIGYFRSCPCHSKRINVVTCSSSMCGPATGTTDCINRMSSMFCMCATQRMDRQPVDALWALFAALWLWNVVLLSINILPGRNGRHYEQRKRFNTGQHHVQRFWLLYFFHAEIHYSEESAII